MFKYNQSLITKMESKMRLLDQAYTDWIEKGYTGRIDICRGD
jgi:hypothetical protein